MRRYELAFHFANPAANGSSYPEVVAFCRDKVVQIGGSFSATVTIEGRATQTDAFGTLTSVTAGAIYEVTSAMHDLRITISNYVSGSVTANFAGFNAQG